MDLELTGCFEDITRRLDALAELPTQVGEMKKSIQMMSEKYDEILNRQEKQKKGICRLNKHVGKLETVCAYAEIQHP